MDLEESGNDTYRRRSNIAVLRLGRVGAQVGYTRFACVAGRTRHRKQSPRLAIEAGIGTSVGGTYRSCNLRLVGFFGGKVERLVVIIVDVVPEAILF